MHFRDALGTAYVVMETSIDGIGLSGLAISRALNTGAVLDLNEEQCEIVIDALRSFHSGARFDDPRKNIALDIAADIAKQKEGAAPR